MHATAALPTATVEEEEGKQPDSAALATVQVATVG